MREHATTDENRAIGVTPSAPWRVTRVEPLDGYRLNVCFVDGTEGVVDLSGLVTSPKAGIFGKLRDETLFRQVYLNAGAVSWPGELDLAPDSMHDEIERKGEWRL